jgi:hypothetical protein
MYGSGGWELEEVKSLVASLGDHDCIHEYGAAQNRNQDDTSNVRDK